LGAIKKNVHAERFSMNCAEEWRRETKEPDLSFESSLLPMSDDNPFYLIVPFDVAWKKGQIYAIANVFLIREMLLPTTVIKKHCRCARQKKSSSCKFMGHQQQDTTLFSP